MESSHADGPDFSSEDHDRRPASVSTLTWLHLSDLHCCAARTGWEATRILRALRQDLKRLRRDHHLAPDLLLFTGDAAFGQLAKSPITRQFQEAKRFFEQVRELCSLPADRVFLVPGNHDVHRQKILKSTKAWLAGLEHEDVIELIRDTDDDWLAAMRGLADYRDFLEDAGYTHLLADPERLVYAHRLTVNGVDIAVAGLNSAWSCGGTDKGKLWLGGDWQLATAGNAIEGADVKIGLIHHPLRWFRAGEVEEDLELDFARLFDFHLHGHEHKPWVHPLDGGTVRIAAGACYDRKHKERSAGYNLVRLDFGEARGQVWLRRYQEETAAWIPHHLHGKTSTEGVWTLRDLRCFPADPAWSDKAGGSPPTPSPPTPAADPLARWLRHVEDENANLTAAFERRGAPELLDHVYVELGLTDPGLARGFGAAAPAPDGEAALTHKGELGRRWTLEDLLDLDPAHYPAGAITRRWLLFGDPGSGKTTLLRHLAWKLARRGGKPWVPVFTSLPWLLREVGQRHTDYLDVLSAELQPVAVAPEVLRRRFERLGDEGRLLWLFDGLDEVPADRRRQLDTILRDAAARWPATPIVVTSRPIGGHRPGAGFRELTLLAFDEDDRAAFLARWLGDGKDLPEGTVERATVEHATVEHATVERALAQLRRVSTLWELAGNPLYLTLLAMLVEDGAELPARRAQLYDLVFDFLLDGKHRPECTPIEPRPVVEDALRHLAWGMTETDRDAEQASDLARRLWSETGLRDALGATPWSGRPQAFLDELAAKTSILAQHDGPRHGWRFWHRTFREALTAQRLEEMLLADGEQALLEHARRIEGDEGRWAEPWALLVGRLGPRAPVEPDALVKTLMAKHRALGLRALTTAQGLAKETINEILATLAEPEEDGEAVEGWQARAVVYRRIPELVGEAGPALDLLDSLRRRTSDGNDLFFVDLAMAEVGQRWPEPEVEREVARIRGGIFDHLAGPESFADVATPVGHLWREIPAGSFLMGSPESEPEYDSRNPEKHPLGVWSDEWPRHEVKISSPFEMAAVPVTNAQYRVFDPAHEPYAWKGVSKTDLAAHPVVNVKWYAAVMFCRWLAGCLPGVRLATEPEWEYACRAGSTTRFWSGDCEDDLEKIGWYDRNSGGRTHQVAEKTANPWGLYDVHGNVWEWTQSPWASNYSEHGSGRAVDPAAVPSVSPADLAGDAGATPGGGRVIRGGGFRNTATGARSACRDDGHPWDRGRNLGFRLVRPVRRPEP